MGSVLVVAAQTPRTITLRLLTGETTIEKTDIVKQDASPACMMPDELVQSLPEDLLRDLIAYLMHPTQVPLP